MKWLISFLMSGFGTDTNAGKALGWTILIFLGIFILAYWAIVGIVKLVKYFKNRNSTPTTVE